MLNDLQFDEASLDRPSFLVMLNVVNVMLLCLWGIVLVLVLAVAVADDVMLVVLILTLEFFRYALSS